MSLFFLPPHWEFIVCLHLKEVLTVCLGEKELRERKCSHCDEWTKCHSGLFFPFCFTGTHMHAHTHLLLFYPYLDHLLQPVFAVTPQPLQCSWLSVTVWTLNAAEIGFFDVVFSLNLNVFKPSLYTTITHCKFSFCFLLCPPDMFSLPTWRRTSITVTYAWAWNRQRS